MHFLKTPLSHYALFQKTEPNNGAAFIEKILRTVPDVGKIFLVIKAKDKKTAIDRLKIKVCNLNKLLFVCVYFLNLKKKMINFILNPII